MASYIHVQNANGYAVAERRLKSAAQAVLDQHPAYSSAGLTIVIANTEDLRELNRRHRQIDTSTDVLAFSAPALPDEIAQERHYLGDILIAYDYAALQAETRGTRLEDTFCLLVIHGALHLLGYLHNTVEASDQMWAAQSTALESLGISSAIVDRYESVRPA